MTRAIARSVRIEEAIGQRVRARRDELGISQEEFGRRLEPLLGKPWSRQTVSMAEHGSRAWAAADLLAVAVVLETTVGDLLRPPIGETAVELGGPDALPRDAVFDEPRAAVLREIGWAMQRHALATDASKSVADDIRRLVALARKAGIGWDDIGHALGFPAGEAALRRRGWGIDE